MPLYAHADFKTTQRYIDLAGEDFREEAERLEERVFGAPAQSAETVQAQIEALAS